MVILVLGSREQISRLSPTVHLSHRPCVTDKLLVYNHVSRLFTLDDFSGICEAGAAPDLRGDKNKPVRRGKTTQLYGLGLKK